jgi:prepilin peptidase CpaA
MKADVDGDAMTVAILTVVVVLPALLAAAAVLDLISFRIPNAIPAAMIILFFVFLIAAYLGGHAIGWSDAGWHVLAGTLGLCIGIALFAAGWVGGGDAKLFAAAVLWFGWDIVLLDYVVMTSILGGALTLALMTLRRFPLPSFLMKHEWFARLSDPKAGIPYGIALALGALFVLPDSSVFQIALQS